MRVDIYVGRHITHQVIRMVDKSVYVFLFAVFSLFFSAPVHQLRGSADHRSCLLRFLPRRHDLLRCARNEEEAKDETTCCT